MPDFTIPAARAVIGAVLAVLAIVTAGAGALRWRGVESAIRRGRPLPAQRTPWVLATGLVVLGTRTLRRRPLPSPLAARIAVPVLSAAVVLLTALSGLIMITVSPH